MAVSSFTNPVFCMASTRTTVIIPLKAANKINQGEARSSVIKKPMTIPGRIEWLIASLINAILRNTRNTPGMAHATEVRQAINITANSEFMTLEY
jgi:hypothetical protein